mgnify:CR=1 FL=1
MARHIICEECKQVFITNVPRFCSQKCMGINMSKNRIGKSHHLFKDTTKKKCQICNKVMNLKPGRIKRVEQMRDYDTQMWVADNSLLKELGWKKKFSLEEGLERCIYG